jgi:NADH-quinone oxidoreductase subunit M
MVLAGTFLWSKIATAFASLGIILAATYILWMVQRVAFGVPDPRMLPKLRDVNLREMVTLVPLVVLVFVIGVFPNPILTRMHTSVEKVIARTVPPVPEQVSTMKRLDRLSPLREALASTIGLLPHRSTSDASRSPHGEADFTDNPVEGHQP